jgi:hypothetical protein
MISPLIISPEIGWISSMELEIVGLSHDAPSDLDVYLISPTGTFIELMSDRGGMEPIVDVDVGFRDDATGLPGTPITSGVYQPEGLFLGIDAGFGTFAGDGSGDAAWILLFIDDSAGAEGSFDGWSLSVQADCNGNGMGDACETAFELSADCDDNSLPDECDPDSDGDLLIDPCDNCPGVSNPSQADFDEDGIGDGCDPCTITGGRIPRECLAIIPP